MTGTRKEVAEAIMALTYVEMMALCDDFIEGVKSEDEETKKVDLRDTNTLADRLRWWAEGHIDYLEDEASQP